MTLNTETPPGFAKAEETGDIPAVSRHCWLAPAVGENGRDRYVVVEFQFRGGAPAGMVTLTPAKARKLAKALLRTADEASSEAVYELVTA